MGILNSHSVLDLFVFIVTGLLTIMVNALRSTIKQLQESVKELSVANQQIAITISKDYITRAENDEDHKEIWEKMDKHTDQIASADTRITRLESRIPRSQPATGRR